MNTLCLAVILWTCDALIGLVAFLGWPQWRWASKAVDRLEARAETLRGQAGARV